MLKGFVNSIFNKIKFQPEQIGDNRQNHRPSTSKLKDVLKTLKTDDFTNFLWLSILKPDARFSASTLSILRKIDLAKSQESLNELARRHLLVQIENTNEYYIHESLRVFASHLLTSRKRNNLELKRLGIKWIDAHQKLILSFQNSSQFLDLRQDRYFLYHISWHLKEAQWSDKIHSIIDNIFPLKKWQDQISQNIINDELNFVNLILLAEKDCESRFKDSPSETLLLLSKYKLMKNIYQYALQNIPAQWVRVLVETQMWSEDKALSYIQAQSSSEDQAERIHLLMEIWSPNSLEILLDIIADTKLDSARAKVISHIFARLPLRAKKRTLSLITEIKSDQYRSMCLSAISPHTPVPLMHSVFTLIQSIQDPRSQAIALERFLPYFTLPLKKKSIDIIEKFEDLSTQFRLLSKLQDTFPHLKQDITSLAREIETDYTKLSVLWKLQNRAEQGSDQIIALLDTCTSNLDKVLFLTDLIPESSPKQLQDIWSIIASFKEETLWSSSIVELLPHIDTKAINAVLERTSKLTSEELKSELCIQTIPFATSPAHYEMLDGIIQGIHPPHLKGMTVAQMLDYLPDGLSVVLQSLEQITDPIKRLEIQISLLEHDEVWGEIVFRNIQALTDVTLQTQFLSQVIFLLPNSLIPSTIDFVLGINSLKNRDVLLNQLTPRLEVNDVKKAILQLAQETYPAALCKNVAKQINRHYWESSTIRAEEKVTQALLQQISHIEQNHPRRNTEDILDDIFNLPTTANQSKILSLCISEIQWTTLQPETLLQIMTILSQGSSLELLINLPGLTQGVEVILGAQSLPGYGNICHQLSQPKLKQNHQDLQSRANTFDRVACPELWPETA